MSALLLSGAADRPRVNVMTALPLMWGEGDAGDVISGGVARSETLKAIDRVFDVRAIDTLSATTLGRDLAIVVQPRRLAPHELVAFDRWVRAGGRAMIFADPDLVWPSRYAPGDPRRAPPVTLLDPLFRHWGVELGDSDRGERIVQVGDVRIVTRGAGSWTGPKTCAAPDPLILDCRIGAGRVILIGDADVLDARLWTRANATTPDWITNQLQSLASRVAEKISK